MRGSESDVRGTARERIGPTSVPRVRQGATLSQLLDFSQMIA